MACYRRLLQKVFQNKHLAGAARTAWGFLSDVYNAKRSESLFDYDGILLGILDDDLEQMQIVNILNDCKKQLGYEVAAVVVHTGRSWDKDKNYVILTMEDFLKIVNR